MDKSDHAQYLASEWWLKRRKEYLAKFDSCSECWIPRWLAALVYGQDLHVHHLNYQTLGAESDDDLQALCRRCHDIEHIGRSDFKAPRSATCEHCGCVYYNIFANACEECGEIIHQRNRREEPSEWLVSWDFCQAFETVYSFYKGKPPEEFEVASKPLREWLSKFYEALKKRVENDEIPF